MVQHPVYRSIAKSLLQVVALNTGLPSYIGDGPGDFQQTLPGADRKPQLR